MKFFVVLCALVAAASADVSHLPSNKYLPPTQHKAAASAPVVSTQTVHTSAPAVSYTKTVNVAASSPVISYSAPGQTFYSKSLHSVPAVSYSTSVKTLETDASVPLLSYKAPAPADVTYAKPSPAVSVETNTYETAASEPEPEPAHTYSATEGYRYKTAKRHRIRRDVSHLSTEYLPPQQDVASAPSGEYLPPVASASAVSYDTSSFEPAHTFSSNDGYRYKTNKRRVLRRNRF